MSADQGGNVLGRNLQRTHVSGRAKYFPHLAKVPPRQINLMNPVENASATRFFTRGVIAAVVAARAPTGQVGTNPNARKQESPENVPIQQLLHLRRSRVKAHVASDERNQISPLHSHCQFGEPIPLMRKRLLHQHVTPAAGDLVCLFNVQVSRSPDDDKSWSPRQTLTQLVERHHVHTLTDQNLSPLARGFYKT